MPRARVLLADDHGLLLEAFTRLLEPEFTVVGRATDGRALVRAAFELPPDVVVADISMPELNGLEASRQIRRALSGVRVVFLTVHEDPALAAEAFRAGGSGYLVKELGGLGTVGGDRPRPRRPPLPDPARGRGRHARAARAIAPGVLGRSPVAVERWLRETAPAGLLDETGVVGVHVVRTVPEVTQVKTAEGKLKGG